MPRILPTFDSEKENILLCCTGHSQIPFSVQITDLIPSLDVGGRPGQIFPFYVYDEDGSNRRENITDWALQHFRSAYGDESISKWDIFYYVYGLLHHPAYRERYAGNLKRELPRIPLVGVDIPAPPLPSERGLGGEVLPPLSSAVRRESDPTTTLAAPQAGEGPGEGFWAFSTAGQQLAALHLNYESLEPYPLQFEWKAGKPVSYRVEKMKLSKDKTAVQVNDSLILRGIPPEAFEYRLGNRSALEWVIDQYQVKTDKRSGITSDPNQYSEDEQYIVRLVGQVVRVSVETVAILKALPELRFGG
jgi:predicted helicase